MNEVRVGVRRGALVFFTHYQEYGRGFASAFCAWGGKFSVSLQYTPQWKLLAVREFCRLITVLLPTPSIIPPHTH